MSFSWNHELGTWSYDYYACRRNIQHADNAERKLIIQRVLKGVFLADLTCQDTDGQNNDSVTQSHAGRASHRVGFLQAPSLHRKKPSAGRAVKSRLGILKIHRMPREPTRSASKTTHAPVCMSADLRYVDHQPLTHQTMRTSPVNNWPVVVRIARSYNCQDNCVPVGEICDGQPSPAHGGQSCEFWQLSSRAPSGVLHDAGGGGGRGRVGADSCWILRLSLDRHSACTSRIETARTAGSSNMAPSCGPTANRTRLNIVLDVPRRKGATK